MSLDMKAVLVKSIKQGATVGAMKAASKKLTKVLGKKYPALLLLPPEIRDLAFCMLVHMVANAAPDLPGARTAQEVTAVAFEGLLTTTVSSMVTDMIDQVGPLLQEIADESKGLLK